MPNVSIIVPVYNVEKYLMRCLDSIALQTYTDFECILVDDASPDNSPAICDEYCTKDNRFKVIHKTQNEGAPKARKTGLDNAAADFVMHVDSDDWLELNAVELLIENQKKTSADIVRAVIRKHINKSYTDLTYKYQFDNKSEPLVYFFLNGIYHLGATLYNINLFNNYLVPEIHMGDDAVMNTQAFANVSSNKICFITNVIYNYDHTTNGVTISAAQEFSSFTDSPYLKYRLFIEKYLYESGNASDEIISAFSYDITKAILPYINEKKITRKEIVFFYKNYWKRLQNKSLFNKRERRIITIFYISIILGNFYLSFEYEIFNRFKHFFQLIKENGLFPALKYYFVKYL